ncbi:LARGE RIBOSOMAL RNA SUBUNIT ACCUMULATION PROTEIN YCED-like protein 2 CHLOROPLASTIC [Salix koriyanagi]|uniref:LARGE RIBOSOMAL RNA SUBUNIT ACCUMULATION PROTEIN YCED-like protein 2 CHLOROPLASTIC n=1 Tax=Salix koriyanagi TaxID=2511006 RepID=A0A9Q0P6F8_9ROSI|nr:LARGE RIBOSOMAL RNA SUBUNIT ACCUMULATION PROTEIN YCED-like protein 2 CHLOROPLASTIC [Salix koriyanagi]
MSEAGHLVSAQIIKEFTAICPSKTRRSQRLMFQRSKIIAASKRNDFSPISKKNSRAPRRLVSISTADGRWQGKWTSDYLLSLQDLKLEDLIEDEQKDAEVSVNLSVQKHASFGFSVDGRIITSFTRKCSSCFSPYCRKIDTTFNVWILPSRASREVHLPDIVQVIYVKPGSEADIDSLIQETIRLAACVKDTCSELCAKSKPKLIHIGGQKAASIDKRWSILLELKAKNL